MITGHEDSEGRKTAAYLKYVPHGGTLLDCGANVGVFANLAADKFEKIICIEANVKTFQRLSELWCQTPNPPKTYLMNCAVAGTSNETVLVSNPGHSTSASCSRKRRKNAEYNEVTTITLNLLCILHRPNVIKLDIEGFEYEALENWDQFDGVTGLIIEFHKLTNPVWFDRFMKIEDKLQAAGFIRIKPETFWLRKDGLATKWGYALTAYRKDERNELQLRREADGVSHDRSQL